MERGMIGKILADVNSLRGMIGKILADDEYIKKYIQYLDKELREIKQDIKTILYFQKK